MEMRCRVKDRGDILFCEERFKKDKAESLTLVGTPFKKSCWV